MSSKSSSLRLIFAALHPVALDRSVWERLISSGRPSSVAIFTDLPLYRNASPGQLITLVNQLYEEIAHVVNAKQGVIDKFLGDAVLCIFEGTDSAQRAVACGVEMLAAVSAFNAENDSPANQSIQIGIGVHCGTVILGTIGSSERMDSTVLGLTVNLAKRLEESTKSLNVAILISDEVARQLPDGYPYKLRSLGEISLKGSSSPLAVYEVVG